MKSIITIGANLACLLLLLLVFSTTSHAISSSEWVDEHNKYRRRHVNTPDVTWDTSLAAEAKQCAEMVPGTKPLADGFHCNSGENWAGSSGPVSSIVGSFWYNEIGDYDYDSPGFENGIGHFTQIIWKNTKKIGCAVGTYGAVCRYEPKGNYSGQFPQNVLPLKPIGNDLLWYHNWGFVGVWHMNGTKYERMAWLGHADPAWQIVGSADFDNDGITDILWRNGTTGENLIWKIEGDVVVDQIKLESVTDPGLKVVGTGDFNGDGLSDILWRDTSSYDIFSWNMASYKRISQSQFPKSAHPDWFIAGTGDFNGNYVTDILWRNKITGENAVWCLQAGGGFYPSMRYIARTDTGWVVGATGDFNNDHNIDIVWRNPQTGANAVWLRNDKWSWKGGNYSSSAWLPPLYDSNFVIVGTGNF